LAATCIFGRLRPSVFRRKEAAIPILLVRSVTAQSNSGGTSPCRKTPPRRRGLIGREQVHWPTIFTGFSLADARIRCGRNKFLGAQQAQRGYRAGPKSSFGTWNAHETRSTANSEILKIELHGFDMRSMRSCLPLDRKPRRFCVTPVRRLENFDRSASQLWLASPDRELCGLVLIAAMSRILRATRNPRGPDVVVRTAASTAKYRQRPITYQHTVGRLGASRREQNGCGNQVAV
jgi:hypothetical protein